MKLKIITLLVSTLLLASMLTTVLVMAQVENNLLFNDLKDNSHGNSEYERSSPYNGSMPRQEHVSDSTIRGNTFHSDDFNNRLFADGAYAARNAWNFDNTLKLSDFACVDDDSAELVVGINDVCLDRLKDVVDKSRGKIVNTILIDSLINAVVVDLPLSSISSFVEETKYNGLAKYIEPNAKFQIQSIPNDPYWNVQWGPRKIGADWAWNTTEGSSNIIVVVVDTGIYWNHSDLVNNYVPLGYDWVNNDNDPVDDNSHGTHCAGIIAAVINNSIGIAGLANVRIMAEKSLNEWGVGYEDDLANSIIHAVDQGADIISMSWGGYIRSRLIHDAIKYAYDAGVLLVAAAGNDATDMKIYPAAYDEVISVAATDSNDKTASFTNFGDWIELAAPGVNIYSTILNNEYGNKSGTSMATPHVAGVAALIWSRFPNMTRDQVRFRLRYAADDLGDPGFDEHYGYGRINARKAVEQTLPEHDLLIDWKKPPFFELNTTGNINATILNFGTNSENNITVQLWANGTQISSATIDQLASGKSATVGCQWSPVSEGKYNITLYVLPVPNENNTENNVVWAYVYVGLVVRTSVIRSAGNYLSWIITTWETLNSHWYEFGGKIIFIDYTSLDKTAITYQDLVASDADVLIISSASVPEYGWEYTDSEIDAITRYVYEGHGLIITSGTFYFTVSNNNKLSRLFGIDETITWNTTLTSQLDILEPEHPLFTKILNPYTMSMPKSTAVPSGGKWDGSVLVGGSYVALGPSNESSIVTYRGLVYISPLVESFAGQNDLQLLYNAITWSHYEKPDHDLIVSLEAPSFLKPDYPTLLNATVSNIGSSNETSVELQLLIDGNIIKNVTIPELPSNASYTMNHTWSSTEKAIHNVTVYAPPLPSEYNPLNNIIRRLVTVSEPIIQPIEGQWANYTVYISILDEEWSGKQKFTYDHYVSPYQINVTVWQSLLGDELTSWSIVNVMNRWVEKGVWLGMYYPCLIETNITLGSEVRLLTGVATVVGSQAIEVNNRLIDCWRLFLNLSYVSYTFYYDKPSGVMIGYNFTGEFMDGNATLTDTNILIGSLIHTKQGDYAHYSVLHFINNTETAIGTMNFTYVEYIDSRRMHVKVDYALFSVEGELIENFTDWLVVNIQTRIIESGPQGWNDTYYFSWIETCIGLSSSVSIWNQTGTVIGTANHTMGERVFTTWLVYSISETQICFYCYDKVTGLLVKSIMNSLSQTSQIITFTLLQTNVDVTPPTVHITNPQNNAFVESSNTTVEWIGADSETGIAYYLVYVNEFRIANITDTRLLISGLTDGNYKIRVEAYDFGGNVCSDEVTVVIDVTKPTASIVTPTNGTFLRNGVSIYVMGNDTWFDKMELYVDNIFKATFFSEGSHTYLWSTSEYNDGMYIIVLKVYDKAGNKATCRITVTVDNTVPIAEIRQPAELGFVRGVYDIVAYVYDVNLKNASLCINGEITNTWTINGVHIHSWNTTTLNGLFTVNLKVFDKAENAKTSTVTVVIDNSKPIASIMSPTNGTVASGTIKITFMAWDTNLVNASLILNETTVNVIDTTSFIFDTRLLQDNTYAVKLVVVDLAGNEAEDLTTIIVDNTSPTVSIISPEDGAQLKGMVTVSFAANDVHLVNVFLYVDNIVFNVTGQNSFQWNTTKVGDGIHVVKIVAVDDAGNKEEKHISVLTMNVQGAVDDSYIAGRNLGIIVGVISGLIVGVVVFTIVGKRRHLIAPKKGKEA